MNSRHWLRLHVRSLHAQQQRLPQKPCTGFSRALSTLSTIFETLHFRSFALGLLSKPSDTSPTTSLSLPSARLPHTQMPGMPRRTNKPKPSNLVTSQYGELQIPSPEEIGSCWSKAALPRLQFEDGDLLIKLSKHHWLLVHSAVVANVSPVLGTGFSDPWTDSGNNVETIAHPVTDREVAVRTLALKRVDGTYLLEGKVCTQFYDTMVLRKTTLATAGRLGWSLKRRVPSLQHRLVSKLGACRARIPRSLPEAMPSLHYPPCSSRSLRSDVRCQPHP